MVGTSLKWYICAYLENPLHVSLSARMMWTSMPTVYTSSTHLRSLASPWSHRRMSLYTSRLTTDGGYSLNSAGWFTWERCMLFGLSGWLHAFALFSLIGGNFYCGVGLELYFYVETTLLGLPTRRLIHISTYIYGFVKVVWLCGSSSLTLCGLFFVKFSSSLRFGGSIGLWQPLLWWLFVSLPSRSLTIASLGLSWLWAAAAGRSVSFYRSAMPLEGPCTTPFSGTCGTVGTPAMFPRGFLVRSLCGDFMLGGFFAAGFPSACTSCTEWP